MPEQHVERVAGRVRDAEDGCGRDQLSRVTRGNGALDGEGVDDEDDEPDGAGCGVGGPVRFHARPARCSCA